MQEVSARYALCCVEEMRCSSMVRQHCRISAFFLLPWLSVGKQLFSLPFLAHICIAVEMQVYAWGHINVPYSWQTRACKYLSHGMFFVLIACFWGLLEISGRACACLASADVQSTLLPDELVFYSLLRTSCLWFSCRRVPSALLWHTRTTREKWTLPPNHGLYRLFALQFRYLAFFGGACVRCPVLIFQWVQVDGCLPFCAYYYYYPWSLSVLAFCPPLSWCTYMLYLCDAILRSCTL